MRLRALPALAHVVLLENDYLSSAAWMYGKTETEHLSSRINALSLYNAADAEVGRAGGRWWASSFGCRVVACPKGGGECADPATRPHGHGTHVVAVGGAQALSAKASTFNSLCSLPAYVALTFNYLK